MIAARSLILNPITVSLWKTWSNGKRHFRFLRQEANHSKKHFTCRVILILPNCKLQSVIVRMTTCALNLWLNKFSSCKLRHNVAQSTPEFWFLQQTFNFVTCVKNCHTSHRVIGRFTRTKSAGKMLSSRAHLGQLFLRCGTFQDFGHQYLVKDTTFFWEIDKGEMWKENWSARKGYRYRRVTVRFSVVSKSKEGRIKDWRWNEHSALQLMCDAE